MRKTLAKALSVMLALLMTAASSVSVFAAEKTQGLDNFTKRDEYTEGVFGDVLFTDWFHDNVAKVYELGLMNGKWGGRFDPSGNITVAETCTIAARLHSIYARGTDEFEKSSPWYKAYVDYCDANGVLDGLDLPEDLNGQASRGLFAAILRNAFPEEALPDRNYVPDGAVPDVDPSDEYAEAVYALYRSGILTGSDRQGNFYPDRSIKRSEVSAIITRMADVKLRQHVSLCEKAVYVSPDGDDETADGSESSPFATIAAARDAVRLMDKTDCSGITVYIMPGEYRLDESVVLEAQDSGTEMCPVTYKGEDGAVITGGITVSPDEFEKAGGDTLLKFPEEVRDSLVMIDLERFGYTPEDIAGIKSSSGRYHMYAPLMNVDGKYMELARYPNAGEKFSDGWIEIEGGYFLDKYGDYTEEDDNGDDREHMAVETVIDYGEEHMERVLSWSGEDTIFTRAFYTFLWVRDDSTVKEFRTDSSTMLVPYAGGYFPVEGGLMFWYNIPEELDAPGECYIDDNAYLYYYPDERFERSHISFMTLRSPLVMGEDVEYVNFVSLKLESSRSDGFKLTGDHITFDGCTVSDVMDRGMFIEGRDIVITGCEVSSTGRDGILLRTNDEAAFESGVVITNNYVHNNAYIGGNTMESGMRVQASGAYFAHNEVCDTKGMGVWIAGAYVLFEYNYIHDTATFWTDVGAVNVKDESYGSVYRYNLVAHTGFETKIDVIGVASFISDGGNGAEYYGNISYDCTGDGFCLAGARDTIIHNNLVVRPGQCGIGASCPDYAEIMRGNRDGHRTVPEFLLSEEWQEAFPKLRGIYGDFNYESEDNSMFINAPAGCASWDNYYYMDKAYRLASLRGGNSTTLFRIESYYKDYSDFILGDQQNGDLVMYSSKRSHYTLKECLDAANEKYGVMTYEQLGQIGRTGTGIGDFDFDK